MTTTERSDPAEPSPADRPPHPPEAIAPVRRSPRWWRVLATTVTVLAGIGLLLVGTPVADGDTAQDLVPELVHTPALVASLDWRLLPVLVGLAAAHYLLAGVALRAAAGSACRLPLGESTLVQLVATVANRVTPNGLGGAAVNARYLSRRGLPVPEAAGAVAGLGLLGGVADAVSFMLLLVLGAPLGKEGFSAEFRVLGVGLHGVTAVLVGAPWRIGALTAGAAAVSWLVVRSARATGRWGRLVGGLSRVVRQTAGLVRRPGDVAVLMVSSAGTTILLAMALSVSVAAVAGGTPTGSLGGLLAGYMVGSAVGSAVPVPAGIGSTEAALVGTVVLAHVGLGQAVEAVLLFRVMTFWAPVPLGLLAAPRLRQTGAL